MNIVNSCNCKKFWGIWRQIYSGKNLGDNSIREILTKFKGYNLIVGNFSPSHIQHLYRDKKAFAAGGGGWVSDGGVPLRYCSQAAHDDEWGEGEDVQGNGVLIQLRVFFILKNSCVVSWYFMFDK